jgi:hypothetical protein
MIWGSEPRNAAEKEETKTIYALKMDTMKVIKGKILQM